MTKVRIQNRNYPSMDVSFPLGVRRTDAHGILECTPQEAERVLATPGWCRVGEAPLRPVVNHPAGGELAKAAAKATNIDAFGPAFELADRLKSIAGQPAPEAPVAPPPAPAPAAPEASQPAPAAPAPEPAAAPQQSSIEADIKAARDMGITVPKAVLAEGDDAVRTFINTALDSKTK